jgi:hypothetical protein
LYCSYQGIRLKVKRKRLASKKSINNIYFKSLIEETEQVIFQEDVEKRINTSHDVMQQFIRLPLKAWQ